MVDSVEKEDSLGMARLCHPAGHILVFKRNTKKQIIVLRRFHGKNHQFSNNLRLKGAMFNHHMPWGYGGLFEGHGTIPTDVSIEQIEEVLKSYSHEGTDNLYPNLEEV